MNQVIPRTIGRVKFVDRRSTVVHYTLMPDRSWSTEAVVISLSTFGEGHREALLLTPDANLVHAAVFGGAKSKLKALVAPWHLGTAWLYSDPVKKTCKLTDFDVTRYRSGLRENLVRSWCASVCTEIVSRAHGTTDWKLVNAFLDGINVSAEDECRRGLLRFIWRLLVSAGINPDLSGCIRCGSTGANGRDAVLYYSPHEEGCICSACIKPGEQVFILEEDARRWLFTVEHGSPAQARYVVPDERIYGQLRALLFFLLSRMMGGPVKTLETGDGIL